MLHYKQKHLSWLLVAATLIAVFFVSTANAEEMFTVVLLPDTQNYSEKYPETYIAQTEWIKSRVNEDNIQFVIHLGDIVQTAGVESQWKVADKAHKVLEGIVPYSLTAGNHDMEHVGEQITRNTTLYNEYFPPARFEKNSWYGGHKGKDNVNNFCLFEGCGIPFLVLSLEFAPSEETLAWANTVVEENKDRRVIVATHYYMRPEGRVNENKPYGLDGAGPEELWNKFIRKHPNIFMVVSGHVLGGTAPDQY